MLELRERACTSAQEYALVRLVRRLVRVRDGRLVLRYPWLAPLVQMIAKHMPIDISQHATRRELPLALRNRPIVGLIRNPYDYHVSHYTYGWWRKYPRVLSEQNYQSIYPHFPDLSFAEFLDLCHRPRPAYDTAKEVYLGMATRDVFLFYSPRVVPPVVPHSYIENREYEADLPGVHFLRTGCINQDLYDFLCKMGYPSEQIQYILARGKILPPAVDATFQRRKAKWESYYTPELKQFVRTHDDILFRLFPEFDV